MEVALGLLAVVVLIAANAFFVAGEFALVAVNRERVTAEAGEGERKARSVLAALKTLSFQLSGAQLGITVSSLLLGFIAEPTIARVLEPVVEAAGAPSSSAHGIAITFALIIATVTQMVLGELVPKNLAIARPDGVSDAIVPSMRVVNAAAGPLIRFLNASANTTVRLFGIEPQEELHATHSLGELELLVRSSREAGALAEEEYSLLTRSIDFSERTAAEAMVPRTQVVALPSTATLAEMAEAAVSSGHSRFPVYGADLDDVIGIAHVKDIYGFALDARAGTGVSEILQDALLVPESKDLESLLIEMRGERKQVAIVLDEYGGTAGMLSIEDIVEEIVGEIEDEYDPGEGQQGHMTDPMPAGINILSGLLHSGEVEEATGFEIPEGPYDTLAGFILSLFDRIPETGEHVSYEGWEFKVVEKEKNRISKILVVAPESLSEEES